MLIVELRQRIAKFRPAFSMTTAQKLWLGFGALTALLVTITTATLLRVRTIEENLMRQVNVARPRSAAARELEIDVVGYADQVDWHTLIDRLKSVTLEQGPQIQ